MTAYLRGFLGCLVLALAITSHASELIVKVGEEKPLKLTAEDLELLPHQTVKAKDHGGLEAEWTGVPLYQVLQQAGLRLGDSLRGSALAQYVLVTAADGYRTVFAPPEFDPRCTDDPVILADAVNGQSLDTAQGSFRIVLPKERRHFRWVRQVVKIDVLSAR
ncbi:Oxidoreductase molybdopterin binding domain-containing protein [Prosthecobacter debontii]|uniref:Oxidoreductase molybdopterin binding domain-containing protein n=1 Tax=Prosthecobacter debontii TaxID=48467 RepID=A0A1T4WQX0_9BACT|nr:molybdopterin-dependent oxidoreductase [Prosthecobacter debontii]SKA79743.1 Oxidoreductase molybdopterin binding domain-containing protein [Prosthecobacter debontii]